MTTARKTAKKAAKTTPARKAAKKTTANKTTAKTTSAKVTTAKTATAKKVAKKSTAKKTIKKAASKQAPAKKSAKKAAQHAAREAAAQPTPAKKSSKKAAQHAARKVAEQPTPAKKSSKKAAQHAARKAAEQPTPAKKSSKKAAQHAARKAAEQAPPSKPARPAKAPPAPPEPLMGPKYALLKADYKRQPGPDELNRVGGRPIGFDAASWPRREGAPMYHVLTIDLKEHPAIVAQRFRALALFISSPTNHEAYTPENNHTTVVLLTEEDLQKGVPEWPDGLDRAAALRPGRLRLESAAELTRKQLYQESFAGDDPIWLQGDESDEDYADYGDDDDSSDDDDDDSDDDESDDTDETSDDTAAASRQYIPHIFVLQFDERLIRGINLGDAGIMYVYSDSAWFQCH